MHSTDVRLWSAGNSLAGTLMLPEDADRPVPAVVHGPGWLGLRDARLYEPYHAALVTAGIGVLTLDYRGFGGSEGDCTFLDPMTQVADIRAGLDYLESRAEVDHRLLGVFGSGGTGGGNAIYVAGLDLRAKAVVSIGPVADGRDWLHRMRREHEWAAFLVELAEAKRRYVATGELDLVDPRDRIMVATPERGDSGVKADVDGRSAQRVAFISAEAILAYRPLDVVSRIAPRATMVITVEHDAVTPDDHARALYDGAGGPKRLLVQTGTTHYAAYAHYASLVIPMIVDWFVRFLRAGEIRVHTETDVEGIDYLTRPDEGPTR